MTLKIKWRQLLLKKRKAISQERREEAAYLCLKLLDLRGPVLSFSPIGVGFKEQLCEALLPKDPWDIPVQKLYLA